MTDRELLELAAKAAGMLTRTDKSGVWIVEDDGSPVRRWSPLTNDGDAFRLSVKLRIDIDHGNPLDNQRYVIASRAGVEIVRGTVTAGEEIEDEGARIAATRRAIVRAAAQIGRGMA
ncbi:hypothetical protein [Chromobacterium violaceum]